VALAKVSLGEKVPNERSSLRYFFKNEVGTPRPEYAQSLRKQQKWAGVSAFSKSMKTKKTENRKDFACIEASSGR
jgi:hypothetical protein